MLKNQTDEGSGGNNHEKFGDGAGIHASLLPPYFLKLVNDATNL